MTKKKKIILICIGVFFGLLILLPAGLLFYLETDHARDVIGNRINQAVPGTISYETFHLSLLRGRIELKNVLLKSPSDEQLAGFERFFADITWSTLLKGDLTIEEITLEKPRADLRVRKDGTLNLMDAFPPPSPEKKEKKEPSGKLPFNIVVKSLRMEGGEVRFHKEIASQSGEAEQADEKKSEEQNQTSGENSEQADGKEAGDQKDKQEELKAEALEIQLTGNGNLAEQSGELKFQIGKAAVDGPQIQTRLDQCRIEAAIRNGRVHPLLIKLGTDQTAALSLSGTISDILNERMLDLSLDLSASLDEIRESLRMEKDLSGEAEIHLTARGALNSPEVTLRLDYGGGNLAGNLIDEIDLDCHLADRAFTLYNLKVNAASGDLNLQGDVNLQDAFPKGFLSPDRALDALSYQLTLKQNSISLEELLADKEHVKGTVSSELSVIGQGISPQTLTAKFLLELFAAQLTLSETAKPIDVRLTTKADMAQELLTVKELEADAGDMKLRSRGTFQLSAKTLDANLTLNAPNLLSALAPLGLKDIFGTLNLSANVSGPVSQPAIDCDLKGDKLRFQEITVGKVNLNAALNSDGVLNVSELSLENQGSSLQGRGTAQIFKKDSMAVNSALPLNFSLALRDIEAKDFFNKDLAGGTVSGNLDVKGTLNAIEAVLSLQGKKLAFEPVRADDLSLAADINGDLRGFKTLEGLNGNIRLEGKTIDLGAQKLRDIQLISDFDGEKLTISPLRISVSPDEAIEADGWISLKKAYQIALKSRGISLSNIDNVREQNIAKGKILLDLSGTGTFDDPQLEGDIAVKNLQVNGKPLEDFQAHVSLRDQLAQVSGKLNFDLSGSFHLKEKDFSASLVFDKSDLSPYFKLADQKDLSGSLTGKIEAKGNASAADKIEAAAALSDLRLFFQDRELITAQDFSAFFKNQEFSVPGSRLTLLKHGKLEIEGNGKVKGPFDLKVSGDVPLKVISIFASQAPEMKGDAEIFARVKGTPSSPDIQGEIKFKKAGLTIPGLLQELHDLNGRVQFTPQLLTLKDVSGQIDDKGRFELGGNVTLKNFQPDKIAVNLSADALPLEIPDMLDMLLNADLQLKGTLDKSALTGEAVILEGTYYKDINLSLLNTLQEVAKKKRETAPKKPSEDQHPFLKHMSLDISVKHRNAFVVDNNLAELEVIPDLKVYGSLNRPLVSGRAEIESGTVTYQKKEFEVNKGVIDFLNPYKIEPTIDVESEVKVRKWTVLLAVSGTPDQLNFKLTSDPAEEHGDILSLLLLGRTTKELNKGEGGSTAMPAQMIAEIVEETFGDDIKKAAGLDILEVKFNGQGKNGDADDVTVTMGKELSRRMTVKYAVESQNGETVQRAIAEYKFLENMLLTGFQDSKGTFGGELQFRLEFR
jgi:autotransporter translocation and assembly factor TamB